MKITDSPPPVSPTSTTTTSAPTTTTTTAPQFDVHSSVGRGDMEPYIGGLPVYDERPENDLVFGVMTSVGYFFITIVLMIGVIMGDNQTYSVRSFVRKYPFFSVLDVLVQLLWVPFLHCNGVRAN